MGRELQEVARDLRKVGDLQNKDVMSWRLGGHEK